MVVVKRRNLTPQNKYMNQIQCNKFLVQVSIQFILYRSLPILLSHDNSTLLFRYLAESCSKFAFLQILKIYL